MTANGPSLEMVYGPYRVCGWKLVSAMPLPELLPWRGDDRSPDVVVAVDHTVPSHGDHWLCLDEQGLLHMAFQGVTLTVPQGGARIDVHLEPECDPLAVRNYLYGSGLAALCYQHGLFPLHGSAVRVGDRAIIFSGDSGSGKSTLATAMTRHGHQLLSDDVCALEFCEGQPPLLRPAFPRVKLLADAIEGFQFEKRTTYTESPRGTKGHFGIVPLDTGEEVISLPVAAVYMLQAPSGEEIQARPLQGSEAFQLIAGQVHRSGVGDLLGRRPRIFGQLASLLKTVPVFALDRPSDFSLLDRTVAFIENGANIATLPGQGMLAT